MPEQSAYMKKTYLEWFPAATQLMHVGFGEMDEHGHVAIEAAKGDGRVGEGVHESG